MTPRHARPCLPRFVTALAAAAFWIAAAGCAHTFDARTLGVDASMSAPAGSQPEGEAFRINRKAVYLLWGMVPVSRPSLDAVLAGQVTGDARVANLRIRTRTRFWDVFFTALTGGLVVPRSVTYEGVLVRP